MKVLPLLFILTCIGCSTTSNMSDKQKNDYHLPTLGEIEHVVFTTIHDSLAYRNDVKFTTLDDLPVGEVAEFYDPDVRLRFKAYNATICRVLVGRDTTGRHVTVYCQKSNDVDEVYYIHNGVLYRYTTYLSVYRNGQRVKRSVETITANHYRGVDEHYHIRYCDIHRECDRIFRQIHQEMCRQGLIENYCNKKLISVSGD